MNLMKTLKISSVTASLLVVIGYVTYAWLDMRPGSYDTRIIQEVEDEIGGPVVIEEVIDFPSQEEVEERFSLEMSEYDLQQIIHNMSHQKIYASDKWGVPLLITDEKIERLLEVVEANEYERVGNYRRILNRWSEGDFSKAVEDHNFIWNLHDGTVGKAERLFTEEEEKAYILRHFYESTLEEDED
ncbi:DUF6241 domain-containing protein [Alteribacter natronophilus]|uniref:DUF6241 domain-containing protein n=1 Tax=Alteribacter natronophilus TaxID=2583810 RepID=UPI00110EC782|nr:DUF6241 domain-containing protein [Alteribacter natronophilus]TMW70918.1 hypothetical protein FGB90_13155 [Alteribacter natronophilus]